MDFEIEVNITPEQIAQLYQIEVSDFMKLIEGKKVIKDEKTILFIIEEYIQTLKLNKRKSSNTIEYYITILRQFAGFLTTKYPQAKMFDLTEDLFYEFMGTCKPLKGNNLSTRTINTYGAIIGNLFTFAYSRKYITENIKNNFSEKNNQLLPKYISGEIIPKLLVEAKRAKWPFLNYALIFFMLGTGCRVSEVVNLRISDFNIVENLIHVREGKGQKERYVPMYPQVKEVIIDYLKRTGCYNVDIRNNEYLFSKRCLPIRKPLSVSNVQYMINQIFMKLDLKGIYTIHSFRHTFAVNALKVGMEIYDLQEVLGHSDIETTRIYTKRHPQDLKSSVMKYPFPLEDLLLNVMGLEKSNHD